MSLFSHRKKQKKERPYRIKKTGIKDELIDRQILAIHQAIVEKLIANKKLTEPLFDILEERKLAGKLGYGAYLTWFCLLENIEDEKAFKQGVLEDTPRMRKLRRSTPLVGVLNEDERQQALMMDACGTTDISTVL